MLTPDDSFIFSSRRARQMAAARWLAKWSYRLQALFASIGFFIVLLPMLNKSWRGVIEAFSPTAWVFHEFSALGGWALLLLGMLMVAHLILNLYSPRSRRVDNTLLMLSVARRFCLSAP